MKVFLVGLISFGVLDALWLGVVMRGFYRTELGPIARTGADGSLTPIWAAAIPVYVLLVCGLIAFVLPRAAGGSIASAAAWGAAFGVVTYGVYDLTNLATLRGYSVALTFADIAWGAVASAAVAAIMKWTERI